MLTAQVQVLHRSLLLGGGTFDGAAFARDLCAWHRTERRAMEPATQMALHDLEAGAEWWQGGRRGAAIGEVATDCIARAAILPPLLRAPADDRALWRAAIGQTLTTAWAPAAVMAAAAMARLVQRAFCGERLDERAMAEAADWHRRNLGACRDAGVANWLLETGAVAAVEATTECAPGGAAGPLAIVARALAAATGGERDWCEVALAGGRAAVQTACAAALRAAITGVAPTC